MTPGSIITWPAMDCGKLTNTVLVIDDMDLLVLLCYHADKHLKVLFFPLKPKANCTKCRVWDLNQTKDGLGSSHACLVILFIHAILAVTVRQCWNDLGNCNTENGIKEYKVPRNWERKHCFVNTTDRPRMTSTPCVMNGTPKRWSLQKH